MQPTRPMSWYQGSQLTQRSVSCDVGADAVRVKIVEQGAVGDRDAVREAGRAARILQVGDFVLARRRAGRRGGAARSPPRLSQSRAGMPRLSAAAVAKSASSGGIEEQLRIAAGQHHDQLFDIGFAPAEAGRQAAAAPATGRHRSRRRSRRRTPGRSRRPAPAGRPCSGPGAMKRCAWRKRVLAQLRIGIGRGPACRGRRGNSCRGCPWRHNRAHRQASRNRRCAAASRSSVGV